MKRDILTLRRGEDEGTANYIHLVSISVDPYQVATHSHTASNILLYAKPEIRMAQKRMSPFVKAENSKRSCTAIQRV